MLKKAQLFLSLFLLFPSLIFGQKFELINQFQLDTIESAAFDDPELDFVMLGKARKGKYTTTLISDRDGSNIRAVDFEGVFTESFSDKKVGKAKRGNSYGFVNAKGAVILPLEYDYLGSKFVEGKVLGKKNDQWFFIDTLNQATPFPDTVDYTSLEIVNPSNIIAMNDSREFFLLDFEGKALFKKGFSYIKPNPYYDHLFIVSVGRMRGVISSKADTIVPLEHDNNPIVTASYIQNQHLSRSDLQLWDEAGTPVDTKDKTIVKSAKGIGYFFRVTKTTKTKSKKQLYGLCDHDFTTIYPAKFKKFHLLPHGFFQLFYPNDSSFVINQSGAIVLPKNRFKVSVLSPDDLVIEKTRYVKRKLERDISWLDGSGKTILAPPIESIMRTSPIHGERQSERVHTILGVRQKDTTGVSQTFLYDRKGNLLNVVAYDSVYYYTPSLLLVIKNKKQGLINEKGELVLPIAYKDIIPIYVQAKQKMRISCFLKLVTPDGRMGLADLNGNVVYLSDEKVDQLHWVNEQYMWIIQGNTYRVFEWKE